MKKLLLVIMVLFSFTFYGCAEETTTHDYAPDIQQVEDNLQEQINSLELQIELLQQQIRNIIAIEGLNGQTVYYYQEQLTTLSNTVLLLKGEIDGDKVPSYMVGANGEYVSMEELGKLFKTKYFGATSIVNDTLQMGTQTKFQFVFTTELSNEEMLARTMLMINELRNYEFYIIGSCELYINILAEVNTFPQRLSITIPMQVMLNDAFTIDILKMYNGDYDIKFNLDGNINVLQAQTIYEQYILDETFSGYVLDFK